MTIATFRIHKLRLLEKLDPSHAAEVEHRVQLTLQILGTETMPIEAVATIIALTYPTLKDTN